MKIRTALCIAAALALGLGAGVAGATGASGLAWLDARNTTERSVLIGGTVFHMASHTQIRGLDGESLTLDDLIWVPDLESYEGFEHGAKSLFVEFDATEVGTRHVLNWIQLSDGKEGMDPTRRSSARDRLQRARGQQ